MRFLLVLFFLYGSVGWGAHRPSFEKCQLELAQLTQLPHPTLDGLSDPKKGISLFDVTAIGHQIDGLGLLSEMGVLKVIYSIKNGKFSRDLRENNLVSPFVQLSQLIEQYLEEKYQRGFQLTRLSLLGCDSKQEGYWPANLRHRDTAAISVLINLIDDPVILEFPGGEKFSPPLGTLVMFRGLEMEKTDSQQTAIWHHGDYRNRPRLTVAWDFSFEENVP